MSRTPSYYQVYFTASIDGTEVLNVLNPASPITFPDVKVFMGDDVTQPSVATYSNLLWQNLDTTARTSRMKNIVTEAFLLDQETCVQPLLSSLTTR